MTLKDLNIGETAVVGTVGGEGALRQHFLDMGLIPGEVEIGMHFKFRHNIPPIFFLYLFSPPKIRFIVSHTAGMAFTSTSE